MSAQDIGMVIGSASGFLSVMGHVAVLIIRELRRRPENIPPQQFREQMPSAIGKPVPLTPKLPTTQSKGSTP